MDKVKIFKRKSNLNKNEVKNEVNYEKAKEELFDFYAQQSKRIMTYKILAFLLIGLTTVSTLSCVYLARTSKLIPYVIEVDKVGEAKAIRRAEQQYVPKEMENRYFLRDIVIKMRTIPRDNVLFSRNFQQLSYFLSAPMLKKHENTLLREDTNELAKQLISRDVIINSFNKLPNVKDTYQIKWTEKMFSAEGEEINTSNFTGLFKIIIEQPKEIDEININPLGIIVEDFSLSKEEE